MTLKARELLLAETSQQLEGIYGLLPNGQFRPAAQYPVFASNAEAAVTRKQLESLLADELQAGLTAQQTREKLVKEAAFTWLNRLVAFKMMETRKLVRQIISRGQDSNGFKLWLTEQSNEAHRRDYEAGDLPQDGLGEGPRSRAYRLFLLAECAQKAEEIRVLFDPTNLSSMLYPRLLALRQLIDLLNHAQLQEAWQPGNEDTIGWVYQFFIEEEKKAVFDRLYKKKEKIRAEDIPAATQIFTPRWIVRCLVQNTLGRMWVQMHPDSRVVRYLEYLVPVADTLPLVPVKPVGEIRLLDPACGTMHFGLVAFDLLVEMYREEIEMAGQPGWPQEPSVEDERNIPSAILANNLHGIDIDLRAAQLSALTLYLRAKTLNPTATLSETRLACADIHMLDGERLKQFLQQAGLDKRPIYGRVLAALQERLRNADQLGSLLRLDEEIHKLVEEERRRFEKEGRQPDLFGWSKGQLETEAGEREFWQMMEIQIGQALDEFARLRASEGTGQGFFAAETTKGLRLLEIAAQRYDVVFTNPPYMSRRNMNAILKQHLDREYPVAKSDLYAAFVQRCTEWLADGGRLGMITQQSFMFISSYEKLREFLRARITIETMPHVGPRAFDEVSGEKVNTTLLVFRRELLEKAREDSIGTYFRLVKSRDGEAKRLRFERALAVLHVAQHDPVVFRYRQGDFDAIPGSPWVYWIASRIRNLFHDSKKLGDYSKPGVGQNTGDNLRFLRFWWEVGSNRIAFGCANQEEATASSKRWFPYMKGGRFLRWYGNQEYVVNWWGDGIEVKAYAVIRNSGRHWSRYLQNLHYNFREGVTWSDLTSGRFACRYRPKGFICDVKGSSACPPNIPLVLGILNSGFAHYILSLLNPTVSFQVGDISRVPMPARSSNPLENLVGEALLMAKMASSSAETSCDFVVPPSWETGIDDVSHRHRKLANTESEIDEEIYRLYGISAGDRVAIETELAEPTNSQTPGDDIGDQDPGEDDAEAPEPASTREELAKQWISYAVGIVVGRFRPGIAGALGCGNFSEGTAAKLHALVNPDAILVLDEGHADDLTANVLQALKVMLSESEALSAITAGTGEVGDPERALRGYMERTFFKQHVQRYRKRPVYWLLQSSGRKYSVWLFHENLTKDTLYRIRGDQYVGSKIRLLEGQLTDIRKETEIAQGRERRLLEKQIAEMEDALADTKEFAQRIDAILQRGYTPHIDDGVLINMAPLWELIPSWQSEPEKCWEALKQGDYDWSHQAMDHWPQRVLEKCQTNKSFAIAHGLTE